MRASNSKTILKNLDMELEEWKSKTHDVVSTVTHNKDEILTEYGPSYMSLLEEQIEIMEDYGCCLIKKMDELKSLEVR